MSHVQKGCQNEMLSKDWSHKKTKDFCFTQAAVIDNENIKDAWNEREKEDSRHTHDFVRRIFTLFLV